MGRLAILVLMCAAVSVGGCGETYEWNQKLTVEVDTPDGVKRGSSVVHIEKHHVTSALVGPEARGVNTRVTGEATVVELASGQYLFALLGDAGSLVRRVFADDLPHSGFEEWVKAVVRLRSSRPVPREDYPLLVRFSNIEDPMSVGEVDPDNLADSFGEGYRLRSIQLEVTDEEVTDGRIESVLKWLSGLAGGYLHGRGSSLGSPLGLHGGYFITTRSS